MNNWIVPAILSLMIYGLWAFFPKLAVAYISPKSMLVYEVAGGMVVGIAALFWVGFKPETHHLGILFAVLTGICGMLGTLFYFYAASRGKISVVASLTALYPLITIILAMLFLKEPLTLKQGSGMLFALVAIILLSS